MNTVLYFSVYGAIYETQAYTTADIDQLVRDHGLHCLTSADRQFDFWFSPSTHSCQRHVNRKATELLLATTVFTPKSVPLLRGCVVVATHDADGELDGLSWQQLDLLARRDRSLTEQQKRALGRHIIRADGHRDDPLIPAAHRDGSHHVAGSRVRATSRRTWVG
ncbi:hypothetical protein VST63_03330 [Mycolicibacterium sp. 050232]|uniref:hypothetical protein n=1 Tax=Mycolicibacterium sp. 050232 TaxID=3113982 RepID=UPI002E29714B|nr:hypothetical protein [Mycolicibacterium sp. 050232]MED5811380.1 hypothetical protein [Mycolicibacterium sp. 050232]